MPRWRKGLGGRRLGRTASTKGRGGPARNRGQLPISKVPEMGSSPRSSAGAERQLRMREPRGPVLPLRDAPTAGHHALLRADGVGGCASRAGRPCHRVWGYGAVEGTSPRPSGTPLRPRRGAVARADALCAYGSRTRPEAPMSEPSLAAPMPGEPGARRKSRAAASRSFGSAARELASRPSSVW